jgi:phage terminase small subunit
MRNVRSTCDLIVQHTSLTSSRARGEVYDLRQYPAVAQRNNAIANIAKLGDRLGIGPSARTRIHVYDSGKPKSEIALRLLD